MRTLAVVLGLAGAAGAVVFACATCANHAASSHDGGTSAEDAFGGADAAGAVDAAPGPTDGASDAFTASDGAAVDSGLIDSAVLDTGSEDAGVEGADAQDAAEELPVGDGGCLFDEPPCRSGVCDDVPTDPTYGTCQNCSAYAGCTPPGICDEVPGDPHLGTCVACDALSTGGCLTNQVCELASGPAFDTCVQCTSRDTSQCTPAAAICDTAPTSPNFDKCVQCSAAASSACTGSQVCDTTPGDSTFDTCVACTPSSLTTVNAACQAANPATLYCSDYGSGRACGQCTSSACSQCTIGGATPSCTVDCNLQTGHCLCTQDSDCPAGTTCDEPDGSMLGACN